MNTGIWYKKSSTGKMVQWRGWAEGDTFYVESGQVDGKKTTTAGHKCIGKQKRTDSEQASFQLNAKLNKKKDDGYLNDLEKAKTHVIMLPMLAHSFKKRSHNITYPAIVQRKFDGVRCFALLKNGEVSLTSRKGKEFPHMNHIREEVKSIGDTSIIFDGELYSDDMTFQELVGLVKREKHKDGDDALRRLIKLRVYDAVLTNQLNADFITRYETVSAKINGGTHLIIAENFPVESAQMIQPLQQQFVQEGYEGAMVRNRTGAYKLGNRSADLQKVKTFLDGEYEIVGFEQAVGNDVGTVIWVCTSVIHYDVGMQATGNNLFKVRPRGTREQRREWFNNAESYIGKMLTVRYQELTDDEIPRFPVGISVRDYE